MQKRPRSRALGLVAGLELVFVGMGEAEAADGARVDGLHDLAAHDDKRRKVHVKVRAARESSPAPRGSFRRWCRSLGAYGDPRLCASIGCCGVDGMAPKASLSKCASYSTPTCV